MLFDKNSHICIFRSKMASNVSSSGAKVYIKYWLNCSSWIHVGHLNSQLCSEDQMWGSWDSNPCLRMWHIFENVLFLPEFSIGKTDWKQARMFMYTHAGTYHLTKHHWPCCDSWPLWASRRAVYLGSNLGAVCVWLSPYCRLFSKTGVVLACS